MNKAQHLEQIILDAAPPTLSLAWRPYAIDDRFEHHDGCKVVEFWPGYLGLLSHGWADSRYVHMWLMAP